MEWIDAMELLSPAGSPEALESALSEKADAIYIGAGNLNARRGASNLSLDDLPYVSARVQEAEARLYLALNIDLSQRALGEASRWIKAASAAGVSAILVRTPTMIRIMRQIHNSP